MAYTTIDDGSAHFHTQLYTGTGSTNAITNDANAGDFKPDWLWIKQRNTTRSHRLITSSFFSTYLQSNTNGAEASNDVVNSLDTDGFTLSSPASVNQSSGTYVAWQWKCNGGTTSSNTDGSITSTVQVNDTAGFSIVTYTGNETAGATIGHGLSAAPDVVIVKNRESSREWMFGHQAYVDGGNTENLRWNSTGAVASADDQAGSGWHRTAFGSSVFTVGDGQDGDFTEGTNNGTDDHVAYCFREIQGYSKFGSYKGNGNADGAFVYTGFRPAWIMVKLTSGSGEDWHMFDSFRSTSNVVKERLIVNGSAAENANDSILDFVSNGFKFRESNAGWNGNGNTYIYMAFAEHPFVSSKGVPVTAR
jgi:hypothetical protein